MKNDLLLRNAIVESLSHQPDINVAMIGVEVHHGCVRLAGRVASDLARQHARRTAERVDGVASVTLDLDVTT